MTAHLFLLLGGLLMSARPMLGINQDATRPFTVLYNVTPEVAAPGTAPMLEVTVKNLTAAEVHFMHFRLPQCFAYFYLDLKLTTPKGDASAPNVCPILSWPGAATTLKPGAEYTTKLPLDKLFPQQTWKAGAYEIAASWKPTNLRPYMDGQFALEAAAESVRGSQFTLTQVLTTLRIKRGDTTNLPDGAKLKFAAHGHKDIVPGSPPGPLIVRGAFTAPGATQATQFETHVYPDANRIMRLANGYTFELGDYHYDDFMELRYFGDLKKTANAAD